MKATIYPSSLTHHQITLPPSKSLAHRAVICAALAEGISHIKNIDYSVDIKATLSAMEKLGAQITYGIDDVIIKGVSSLSRQNEMLIDCQESGSTLRFLIPLFSLCGQKVTFTGKGRLMQRPQSIYENLFAQAGYPLIRNDHSLTVNGALQAGEFHLRGDVSSQFISGLLFALPLLKDDSVLIIEGPFESRSYVDLTIQMLNRFGINIEVQDRTISIPGNQKYLSTDLIVEGDYSQLAFYAALGALQGPVECFGLDFNSLQGDRAIINILQEMNGIVIQTENSYVFYPSQLKATVIDLADCPDLGPALMMLASFANGETRIINARRLRMKESDRIEAMETELRKVGVEIHSTEDSIWISGNTSWHPKELLSSHNDHRIVMSLAIASTLADKPVVIDGAESINKSYPQFFEDIEKLGVKVHVE